MSDGTLLPCPMCGKEASPNGVMRWSSNPNTHWMDGTECLEAFYCNCMSCGLRVGGIAGGYQTQAEAIAKWNHRALTPKQEAAEEMFEALEAIKSKAVKEYEAAAGDNSWGYIHDVATAALAKAGQP